MQHWDFHTNDRMPFGNYAPALMVYREELYWFVSNHNTLYKSATPEDGDSWTVVSENLTPFIGQPGRTVTDPYLFPDDDGRVYLYWGCSYTDPILGVELDPENGFRAKGLPTELIGHHEKEYGWECRGDRNETGKPSCNEGAAMLKYQGRYYLQYAAPGTEFNTYGDGLYVSDAPLGPFEHCAYSPFSIKPGGWMTGAGHGDTFQDRYGNWWHVATTVIVQRFIRERRIGLFPVIFTPEGSMHALTEWSDYPWILPDRKVDWTRETPWTGWMNLTLGKKASASSELPDHPAASRSWKDRPRRPDQLRRSGLWCRARTQNPVSILGRGFPGRENLDPAEGRDRHGPSASTDCLGAPGQSPLYPSAQRGSPDRETVPFRSPGIRTRKRPPSPSREGYPGGEED